MRCPCPSRSPQFCDSAAPALGRRHRRHTSVPGADPTSRRWPPPEVCVYQGPSPPRRNRSLRVGQDGSGCGLIRPRFPSNLPLPHSDCWGGSRNRSVRHTLPALSTHSPPRHMRPAPPVHVHPLITCFLSVCFPLLRLWFCVSLEEPTETS